jgi:AraC-like DNA-binding protein
MEDPLSSLLTDVRSRGALFSRSFMHRPWSLRFEHGSPLTLATLLDGRGWLVRAGASPQSLGPGDLAVLLGDEPFTIGDEPDRDPRIVVGPGDTCTTTSGRPIADDTDLCTAPPAPTVAAAAAAPGPAARGDAVDPTHGGTAPAPELDPTPSEPAADATRTNSTPGHPAEPAPGDGRPAAATLLTATYPVAEGARTRVLNGVPDTIVVPGAAGHAPLLDAIVTELAAPRAGRQVVLDRLLDLLMVTALREWFDRSGDAAPAWFRAGRDPFIGPALRALHRTPARRWTVAGLAAEAGLSRAAFARRFTQLVGEPPMSYLTCWRLCLAADLLRDTDLAVGEIARRVGYANGYALSTAFLRAHGRRPTEHRAAARPPADAPVDVPA